MMKYLPSNRSKPVPMIQRQLIRATALRRIEAILAGFLLVILGSTPGGAEFTFVLKNGRQITAQSYQDENDVFRLSVPGGQFSITKDQVESIVPLDSVRHSPAPIPTAESGTEREPAAAAPLPSERDEEAASGQGSARAQEEPLSPEEILAEQRAKEENDYRDRVSRITNRIKSLMDRYALATRGTSGPDPSLLNTPEAIEARTADLESRLKDARRSSAGPGDAGGVTMETGSAFSGRPPATIRLQPHKATRRVSPPLQPYTEKEKELSDLREQINKLQSERTSLIQKMKQKNFDTGSLFLP